LHGEGGGVWWGVHGGITLAGGREGRYLQAPKRQCGQCGMSLREAK
jgi:hypothetical protein